jgi:HK97 family phage portal protein
VTLLGRALAKAAASGVWPALVPNASTGSGTIAPDLWDMPITYLVPHTGDDPILSGINKTYADLYATQPWLYTVINKLARGIGRLPLKAYSRNTASNNRFRLRNAPLVTLLNAPAPRVTPAAFKQQIVTDTCIYGNALVLKVTSRPEQPPVALEALPPVGWKVLPSGDYRYKSPVNGLERDYPQWQIIHFAYAGPRLASGLALSPMEPLRQTLAIEDAAQRLGVATFNNGARPSGVLSTEKEVSKEVLARLKDDIQRVHGGVDRSMKPAILTNGLKWQAMSWDFQQSAVVDFRKLTREEVCAVYDISPVIVGILDRATFSNIEELHLAYYQDSLGPWTNLIEETLDSHLIAGVPAYANNFVEFDFNEVLKGAIEQRFNAYNAAIQGGWMTPNEARDRENLGRVTTQPEADELHISLALGGSQTGAGRSGTGIPEAPVSGPPNDTPPDDTGGN